MPNKLVNETSPYLRQHQDNPVNWYPWGAEALSLAKEENKPIFLSIGYAACHWCHVMAHESFEDPETAQIMNENFVCIKVDREERPDLDDIYMQAVVMLTGHGGWPMSVFLTPKLKPFYGGTYFPPSPRHGLPSFIQVLTSAINVWQSKPNEVNHRAQTLTEAIQTQHTHSAEFGDGIDLDNVVKILHKSYDWREGGWGGAPKFPQPMVIEFLIQRTLLNDPQALELVNHVLGTMARGGMYDLVGGGFHRYSTDATWLVPHFEKMLYDNALLASAYLHGFVVTGRNMFLNVATETLDFIQRELTSPEGGFYSSLDADTSEGEGRYYTWHLKTLRESLSSEEFDLLQTHLQLTRNGNFENGLNILQYKPAYHDLLGESESNLSEMKAKLRPIFKKLLSIRSKRTPPTSDEKIITAWNALAIRAFAQAGLLLNRKDYLQTAQNASDFILENLLTKNSQLQRSYNLGISNQPGTLADYSGLILALHDLYAVDFEPALYQTIQALYQKIKQEFSSDTSLYFDSASSVSNLIVRPQSLQDNATPSGNALAAHVHWLLGNFEHDPNHLDQIMKMLSAVNEKMRQAPTGFGYWLQTADLATQESTQVALVCTENEHALQPFLNIYRAKYRPHSIVAINQIADFDADKIPELLINRPMIDDKPTAYVCRGFTCNKPVTDPEAFQEQLNHEPLS